MSAGQNCADLQCLELMQLLGRFLFRCNLSVARFKSYIRVAVCCVRILKISSKRQVIMLFHLLVSSLLLQMD